MTDNLLGGVDNLPFDDNKNWYEEYVGEGKKFKTPEDLAKAKAHSDHYIRTMELARDKDRETILKLQEEYNAAQSLRELIDRLDTQQHASRDNTDNSNDVDRMPATFDPKQIDSLVSSKVQEVLNQTEQQRREQANYEVVKAKAVERFGDNYRQVLKNQADSLDMSETEVDALARRNPKLFIKTFGLDGQQRTEGFQAPPQNSMRRDNFVPMEKRQHKTKSYYEDLRKKSPREYLNPKTLIQMEKDVQALGWEAFNDVD